MKNILIINGHPNKESFCFELAKQYKAGADASGGDCKLINLIDLDFSPVLKYGYRKRTELEPDLVNIQKLIKAADHLVFVYPNWWGSQPALLKGFIDRVFLPNFAFSYRDNSLLWDKLLTGKSARLIVTMDTPTWYYKLIYKSPGHNAMKKGVLGFCGVKPVKITSFSPVKSAIRTKRQLWLKQVEQLGEAMK
ncbi:NAD(P)H-dependent oxidoreductase [Carboxylicivirga sp. M1479]|uniref:NAD(P)H-dependent oxidoreductase n=1 Tax=Carboxylicivirga sp. M1479 TaxID=2594476 RepID=UPI001177658B|nr:NAD(P)H-dependent oxidoreductase [Carboxylicivirga sp. M1479]TRX61022.1 NAD(P)H-dependent oxidoreductase [Carboxylicivirga sp. M1479]